MLDDAKVAAPINVQLLVPVLGFLLGVRLEILLEIIGPEIVNPPVDLAGCLTGLDLGVNAGRDRFHAIDRRVKPDHQGHEQQHQRDAQ